MVWKRLRYVLRRGKVRVAAKRNDGRALRLSRKYGLKLRFERFTALSKAPSDLLWNERPLSYINLLSTPSVIPTAP